MYDLRDACHEANSWIQDFRAFARLQALACVLLVCLIAFGLPLSMGSDSMQIKVAGFLKITGAVSGEILILGLIVDINQFIVFHIGFI